jgi:hypothetical protein
MDTKAVGWADRSSGGGTRTAGTNRQEFLQVNGLLQPMGLYRSFLSTRNRAFCVPFVPRIGAFAQVRGYVVASRRVRRIPFRRSADLPKCRLTCENTAL